MTDTLNPSISSESGLGSIAEQSPQPLAQESKPVSQQQPISDATRRRRLETMFGPALFAEDSTWDLIGYTTGFCSVMYPLRKKIQQRARKYRRRPSSFIESVNRLVLRRRQTDPVYDMNFQKWTVFCKRIQRYFQEPPPRTFPTRNLSKDQRRQFNRFLDFVGSGFPLRVGLPSEESGRKAIKLLAALGTTGRGRKLDPDSQKLVRLWENGKHGYGRLAKTAWPDLFEKATTPDEKRRLRDRAREIIRRYKQHPQG